MYEAVVLWPHENFQTMDCPAQKRGHFLPVQCQGLLHTAPIKIGHGEDSAVPVGGEPHVDRQLVSVLVKDFCMDFKGKRIDDELLLLPVPLGVGEVRIVDFPRQLRHLRAAVMHTVFQPLFIAFA